MGIRQIKLLLQSLNYLSLRSKKWIKLNHLPKPIVIGATQPYAYSLKNLTDFFFFFLNKIPYFKRTFSILGFNSFFFSLPFINSQQFIFTKEYLPINKLFILLLLLLLFLFLFINNLLYYICVFQYH